MEKVKIESPKTPDQHIGKHSLFQGAAVAFVMSFVGILLSMFCLHKPTLSWAIFFGGIGAPVGIIVSGTATWREAFNRGVLPGLMSGAVLWPAGVTGKMVLYGQLDERFANLAEAVLNTLYAGGILGIPIGGIAGVVSTVISSVCNPKVGKD